MLLKQQNIDINKVTIFFFVFFFLYNFITIRFITFHSKQFNEIFKKKLMMFKIIYQIKLKTKLMKF